MIRIYPFTISDDGPYDSTKIKFESACGEIYLHGKLQDDNGYDLCGIKKYPEEDGIYDCEVMMPDGARKAKFFFWQNKKDFWGREKIKRRGLVVQNDDAEHIQDATMKYTEKREYL